MRNIGLTEIKWSELDQEVDKISTEIELLDPLLPFYNLSLDRKIKRLEEIEALIDDSIFLKQNANRPRLYVL